MPNLKQTKKRSYSNGIPVGFKVPMMSSNKDMLTKIIERELGNPQGNSQSLSQSSSRGEHAIQLYGSLMD